MNTFKAFVVNLQRMTELGFIANKDNAFYLETLAAKEITIVGYCEAEDMFTCKEYPEYAIPSVIISHVSFKTKISSNLTDADTSFREISDKVNHINSAENARKILNKAMANIKSAITRTTFLKEYPEYDTEEFKLIGA